MSVEMRVLMVSPFFPAHGGGVEVVAGQLAKGFAESGVSVEWFAGGADTEVPAAVPGILIRHARAWDVTERRLGIPWPIWGGQSIMRLFQALRRSDLVHVHDYLYFPSIISYLMARVLRKPFYVTQHIGMIEYRSVVARLALSALNATLGRWILSRADGVFFVSPVVQEYFSRLIGRSSGSVIPNGVDHQIYRYANPLKEGANLKALFVGRFVEKKGIPILRQCLDLPGVEWTFVGDGPDAPVTDDHGGTASVFRSVRGADVVGFYHLADVLILPSVGEGFPLVVQEALACGTPVLVSSEVASAFPELDPACVFVVDLNSGDPVASTRQAIAMLSTKVQYLRRARQRAHELSRQWSWGVAVERYLQAYGLASSKRHCGDVPINR